MCCSELGRTGDCGKATASLMAQKSCPGSSPHTIGGRGGNSLGVKCPKIASHAPAGYGCKICQICLGRLGTDGLLCHTHVLGTTPSDHHPTRLRSESAELWCPCYDMTGIGVVQLRASKTHCSCSVARVGAVAAGPTVGRQPMSPCKASLRNRGPQHVLCGCWTDNSSSLWTENDHAVADTQPPQATCALAPAARRPRPLRPRGAQRRRPGRPRPGSPRFARRQQPTRPPWLQGLSRPWRTRRLPLHGCRLVGVAC
jgi:hypothetical protein